MLLCLDYESEVPIYLQIRNQIVIGIANEEILDGEKLPTIRALSNDLGINMMTVSKAYQLLRSEGYICGDRRSGAIIKKPDNLPQESELSDQSLTQLKIIASEAKLRGISSQGFIELCATAYSNASNEESD